MSKIIRAVKLASNPKRKRAKSRRNGAKSRRRMSAKQIRIFGSKRQKSALKAANRRSRNSSTRKVRASRPRRRRKTQRNPAPLLVTLGTVNPRRKKARTGKKGNSTMARSTRKRGKKRNSSTATRRRRSVSRRRNRRSVTRTVVAAPRRRRSSGRRRNTGYSRNTHRRRHSVRRSRNPFGATGVKGIGTLVAGGLGGVALTKFLPGLLPANLIPQSDITRAAISAAAAFLVGWAGKRFLGPTIGDAMLFGGLMQAGSVALNTFLPSVGSRLALSGGRGVGYLADGSFVVPQNPMRGLPAPAPAAANGPAANNMRVTMNGLTRAFGTAF